MLLCAVLAILDHPVLVSSVIFLMIQESHMHEHPKFWPNSLINSGDKLILISFHMLSPFAIIVLAIYCVLFVVLLVKLTCLMSGVVKGKFASCPTLMLWEHLNMA